MLSFSMPRPSFTRRVGVALALLPLLSSLVLMGAAPAQAQDTWTSAPNMSTGRYAPGIVRLRDNSVLVAGGYNASPYETASAEIYNPTTNAWALTGSLRRARNFPVGMLVDENADGVDETPIFFGGFNSYYGSLNTAERYDTAAKTFSYVTYTVRRKTYISYMTVARELFTATKLPDGKVLLAGGLKTSYGTLRSAEIYDPVTRRFTATGSMTTTNTEYGRFGHDAILLPDKRNVLVVGGKAWLPDNTWPSYNTAEIYNIEKKTFTAIPFPMKYHRDRVTLARVGNRILVVGGTDDMDYPGTASDVRFDPLETEWFDPAAYTEVSGVFTFSKNPFTVGPALAQGRMAHTLTPLSEVQADGSIKEDFLVVGGWAMTRNETLGGVLRTGPGTTATAERFVADGVGGGSFVAVPSAAYDTLDHGAVSLVGGQVLVVGGKQGTQGNPGPFYYPARAELYTP